MEKYRIIISSFIIALGVCMLGFFINNGFDTIANRDRIVTVKGLAEKTVHADKVTWPIVSKELGDDLPALYDKINRKTKIITDFLVSSGLSKEEINVNAPEVLDLNADRYSSNNKDYRYNITSVITVTSNNVKKVREIIANQGELLKKGIAIINGGYENPITYEYTNFNKEKPSMMAEAIANAEKTALQFAENSHSKLDKIVSANQGQFSIETKDITTPYIKEVRVVTTITYSLKD